MKKELTLFLLIFIIVACKKDIPKIEPNPKVLVKSISNTMNWNTEELYYANGKLTSYVLDKFGDGGVEFTISYDQLNRPISVKKENLDYAQFYYHDNTITLVEGEGISDSLVYTIVGNGKISELIKYDNFGGRMVKNALQTYFYTQNNLTKLECVEYNRDGSKKTQYVVQASFDENKNALECTHANLVLFELLLTKSPTLVFALLSKNNVVQLTSNHFSDGYSLTQKLIYNSAGYPTQIIANLFQYGFFESSIEFYEYE